MLFRSQKRPDLAANVRSEDITRGGSIGCHVSAGAITPITSPAPAGSRTIPTGAKLNTPDLFFDPCAYSLQPLGTLGNAGRSLTYGPNFSNINFSLVKDTKLPGLGETGSLEFRSELFNLLNHPSYGIPARTVDSTLVGSKQTSSTFSKSREIQFALKLIF